MSMLETSEAEDCEMCTILLLNGEDAIARAGGVLSVRQMRPSITDDIDLCVQSLCFKYVRVALAI